MIEYLVFGASGGVGSAIYSALGPERCIGFYNETPIPHGRKFDIRSAGLPDDIPDSVTHAFLAMSQTSIKFCTLHPEESYEVNVECSWMLASTLMERGITPVFYSSDAVFDGSIGNYLEEDARCPTTEYGRQKVIMEQRFENTNEPWLILRPTKVLAWKPPHGLILELKNAVVNSTPIRVARELMFSPISMADVATASIRAAQKGLHGLYNLGGPTTVTRLELVERFLSEAGEFGQHCPKLTECSLKELGLADDYPRNPSLNSSKIMRELDVTLEQPFDVISNAAHEFWAKDSHEAPDS